MLTVSNYHYIRESFDSAYPSIFGLTPKAFEQQLLQLAGTGKFIAPDDLLVDADAILDSAENHILVTFDDGLREQFESAKPVLDKLAIKALYFVNSINFIERKVSAVHKIHLLRSVVSPLTLLSVLHEHFPESLNETEKRQAESHYNYDDAVSAHLKYQLNFKLSAAEQSFFADSLFADFFDEAQTARSLYFTDLQLKQLGSERSVGSHTHSHLALGLYGADVIEKELFTTKNYLKALTGADIPFVSYPYGNESACCEPVPTLAKKVGHSFGFTVERGVNSGRENRLLLKRFDCNDLPGGKNYRP